MNAAEEEDLSIYLSIYPYVVHLGTNIMKSVKFKILIV